jgi:stage III sporulation protein AH
MMVFRRKQIVVLSLVLMIVVAGYLQYSYRNSSSSAEDRGSGRLGEAVFVDGKELETSALSDTKETKNTKGTETPKDSKASSQANDYFSQAKLDREVVISKDTDSLEAITIDANASKEIKAQAYEKMMKIVDNSEMEMKIEVLLKEKDFEDAICLISEDGSVDVVVKAPSLDSAQVAQIASIVTRHAKVDMGEIHISNKY